MFGEVSGEVPAAEGSGDDQPPDSTSPLVKHEPRSGGVFNLSGPARDVQDARHTKDAYEHEIKLREIACDEAQRHDEHELKKAQQAADILENARENNSRRRFRLAYFILPVVAVLALITTEVYLHAETNLSAEKLGTVDGVIRLAIGWFIGMVSAGALKPGDPKTPSSGE